MKITDKEPQSWRQTRPKSESDVNFQPEPATVPTSATDENPKRSVALAKTISTALCKEGRQMFDEALTKNPRCVSQSGNYYHGPTKQGSPLYQVKSPYVSRTFSVPARRNNQRFEHANEDYRVELLESDSICHSYPGVLLVSIKPPDVNYAPETDDNKGYQCDVDKGESSPLTDVKPVPAKTSSKRTKKARHWVDELTVSSGPLPSGGAANNVAAPTLHTAKPEPEVLLDSDEEHQENDEETSDETIVFPAYACPSSEQKSREYATRNWISQSSFTGSLKTVPMI